MSRYTSKHESQTATAAINEALENALSHHLPADHFPQGSVRMASSPKPVIQVGKGAVSSSPTRRGMAKNKVANGYQKHKPQRGDWEAMDHLSCDW